MAHKDILEEKIKIGQAMKSFLVSPQWVAIKDYIENKDKITMNQLRHCSKDEFIALQAKAQVYQAFLFFPQSLVDEGDSAKLTLEEGDEE